MTFGGEEGNVMVSHMNFDDYSEEMEAGLQMDLGLGGIRQRIVHGAAFD